MRRPWVATATISLSLMLAGVPAAAQSPPARGSFEPTGPPAVCRVWHTATGLSNGLVLVIGSFYCPSTMAEAWDPATGKFGPAGTLAAVRVWHSATLLADGRVLVVGGDEPVEGGSILASAEIWDPTTGTFGATGSLAVARGGHTATLLLDGRVLVIGGKNDDGDVASAEIWDPATGTFSPTGAPAAASGMTSTATLLLDGRVFVTGGPSAEIWDPATGTFSPTGAPAVARGVTSTATLLLDGRVLVVGGIDDDRSTASSEIWDPATGTFSPAASLAEARSAHTATLLDDGRVLVVGGLGEDIGAGTILAGAEIWDPATEMFGPAGSLAEPLVFHTATKLPDGRVLVVGAFEREEGVGASVAEIWSPVTTAD